MPEDSLPQSILTLKTDEFGLMYAEFYGLPIRCQLKNGEPLFVVDDLCKALEVKNPRDAIKRLDADEIDDVVSTDAIGRQQKMIAVTEPGLYRLALTARTRSEHIRAFQRWAVHDLMPAVRKYGGYISPSASEQQIAALQAQLDNAREALRLFGVRTGAGRFLESTLPRKDRD